MRRTALAGLVLTGILASCNQQASAPVDNIPVQKDQASSATDTPEDVAKYFIEAGVPKERLEQMKQDLIATSKYIEKQKGDKISVQSADNVLKDMKTIFTAIDIAKDGRAAVSSLTGQAYTRSLLIQATNNIALNSLSNFEYYQAMSTYSPPLTYVDDGCSSPQFMAGNATFLRACDQHDFGWRNGSFWRETHNSAYKSSVDAAFNTNMFQLCRERWGSVGIDYSNCANQAAVFYTGVRAVPVCLENFNTSLCWASEYKDGTSFSSN